MRGFQLRNRRRIGWYALLVATVLVVLDRGTCSAISWCVEPPYGGHAYITSSPFVPWGSKVYPCPPYYPHGYRCVKKVGRCRITVTLGPYGDAAGAGLSHVDMTDSACGRNGRQFFAYNYPPDFGLSQPPDLPHWDSTGADIDVYRATRVTNPEMVQSILQLYNDSAFLSPDDSLVVWAYGTSEAHGSFPGPFDYGPGERFGLPAWSTLESLLPPSTVITSWYSADTTGLVDTLDFVAPLGGVPPCCRHRGNVDGAASAGGVVDVADVTYLVAYLFDKAAEPHCLEDADVNADGTVDLVDLVYLADYLFRGGPAPPACW